MPAEIKQTEALEHFDSSWGKHNSYFIVPVWENELQGGWSQQGRKKALWLKHRLRVGVSDCLGVKRELVVGR